MSLGQRGLRPSGCEARNVTALPCKKPLGASMVRGAFDLMKGDIPGEVTGVGGDRKRNSALDRCKPAQGRPRVEFGVLRSLTVSSKGAANEASLLLQALARRSVVFAVPCLMLSRPLLATYASHADTCTTVKM